MTTTLQTPPATRSAATARSTTVRPAMASRGLLIALLSAGAFGLSGSMGASLLDAGWSTGAASLLRIGGGALVLLPFTVTAVVRRRPSAGDLKLAAVYGIVAIAGAQFAFFNAVQYLSVGVALLLEYLAPILIVLFTWGRTRRAPGWHTLSGTVVAMVGLVLVLDLTGTVEVSLVGVAWGLGAALCLSAYFILSAREMATMSPLTLTGVGTLAGAGAIGALGLLGVLPMRATTAPVELLGTMTSWLIPATVLILIATVVAYATGIVAAQRLGSRVASFVGLSEVLFAVVFAWLLVDQLPGPIQLLGGVFILAGVALVRADRTTG